MSRGRAILTFARSWQALAAVRSLGRRGVEVMTGDEISLTPASLSMYSKGSFCYPNPDTDPDGFLDALDEAVDHFRPPAGVAYALLPVHREAFVVARNRERFEGRVALALPPAGRLDEVRDKGRLVDLAASLGVRTPRTWQPADVEELRSVAGEVVLPAFVKPRCGVGGVGIEKVATRQELLDAWPRVASTLAPGESPPIVQEAVPGDDYCVAALLDHGEVRAVLTYRNLRSLGDVAPGAVRETVRAPAAEAVATHLLEGVDWHGIAQVDFIWTGEPDDPPVLIEVNPRMFSGLFQAIASGVDLPWLLFRLAVGQSLGPQPDVDLGVKTETPVVGLLATLRDAAEDLGRWEALGRAWRETKERAEGGHLGEVLSSLLGELRSGLDLEGRREVLRGVIEERQALVSQLFPEDDPAAAIGVLYPLAAFLAHGDLSAEGLVGAKPLAGSGKESESR